MEDLAGIDHLQFDTIRPGFSRRVYQIPGFLRVRSVGTAQFRDDKCPAFAIDGVSDGKFLPHTQISFHIAIDNSGN
jgi:hypothetical protein